MSTIILKIIFFHLVDAFRKKRNLKSLGMPHFVGHGSHDLNAKKHRFIVMPRFGSDIWTLFNNNGRKMPLHTVFRLAIQMVNKLFFDTPDRVYKFVLFSA